MNYLKISNTGLLDVEALSLLGASTKRGDNSKIGQFGSGNKYAIAYLLRNNYDVKIFSGTTEIKIDTVTKSFRDKTYSVIRFNEKETSITTEFGKDWQLWQAIREVYCNAIDEGNDKMEYVSDVAPIENETHFYIKNRAEVSSFVSSFDKYFSQSKRVLFECSEGKIIEKSGEQLNLYRRGIRCLETDKHSIFDYDLKDITIDENRLVCYPWQVSSKVWSIIYQCTNKEVIKQILFCCADAQMIECIDTEWTSLSASNMSQEFKEVLRELKLAPRTLSGLLSVEERGLVTIIPSLIFDHAKAHIDNNNLATKFKVYKGGAYVEIENTPLFNATLSKALDFFNECGYDIKYPVQGARFDDKNILGFADKQEQKIIVSEICMDRGVQEVVETIIEENIHLKYDVSDETRGFQNAAIQELVTLLKVQNAYSI